MGCDIHLRVQVKAGRHVEVNTRTDGSTYEWVEEYSYKGWRAVENKVPNRYWGLTSDEEERHIIEAWYSGRNYDFFAILANVRNGHGFAGVETGSGFDPIVEPRGLPSDLGDLNPIEDDYNTPDGFWLGDHSHSWVTLRELREVGWDTKTTVQYGVVDHLGFAEWKEKGEPSSYCGGISGGGVKHVSNEAMEVLIARGEVTVGKGPAALDPMRRVTYYTRVQWTQTYRQAVGGHVMEFIAQLEKLCTEWAESDPERVRLVFGFDS